MDGDKINQKIRFGYAKAATKLGTNFQLYRSATSIDPISPANLIGTLKMCPTQDWTFMKGNRPGNAIWYLLVDGQDSTFPLSVIEGDYLVGFQTFFILSKQFDLPIQGVECNRTLTIIRPTQSIGPGQVTYAGYTPATSDTIMSNIPSSVLLMGRGSKSDLKLPTDDKEPLWRIMLPNLGDVNIKVGDIIIDDVGQNFVINDNEETEFGWRLTAQQVVNQ